MCHVCSLVKQWSAVQSANHYLIGWWCAGIVHLSIEYIKCCGAPKQTWKVRYLGIFIQMTTCKLFHEELSILQRIINGSWLLWGIAKSPELVFAIDCAYQPHEAINQLIVHVSIGYIKCCSTQLSWKVLGNLFFFPQKTTCKLLN